MRNENITDDINRYRVGIDLSVNSSAIVITSGTKIIHCNVIVNGNKLSTKEHQKIEKILRDFKKSYEYHFYYLPPEILEGKNKEEIKTEQFYHILKIMEGILKKFKNRYHQPNRGRKIEKINIESIAFQASGTIDVLSGINYGTRLLVKNIFNNTGKGDMEIPKLCLISPNSLKLQASGYGTSDKTIITDLFLDSLKNNPDNNAWVEPTLLLSKIDDIADAYFLSLL